MFAFQVNVTDELEGAFNVNVTFTVRVRPPLVTVMVVELFPWVAVVVFTLAVMVPLFEPDVGVSDSQEAPSLALHAPLELMAMVWAEGFAAPCVAVYVTLLGETVKEVAVTVSVTDIVLVTPPLVTVIVAVFVPTTADDRVTFAATDPLPLPDDGLRVSQVALLPAVQLPFELIVTAWLTGFAPP